MITANLVPCNKLRIAIIDEDSAIRLDLCSLLEAQGHQVKHFQSSDGFLDAAKLDDFDCILLELWFKSGMSGLDMLRHLAGFGRLKPTVMGRDTLCSQKITYPPPQPDELPRNPQ
jgi:FixJ family two-component response regulator